ncbi:hypothetical protein BSHJ18_01950 [Bacillus velezensis]|nr:hypothetical protein BSHJ18_01950 [Bacillus velezensis]
MDPYILTASPFCKVILKNLYVLNKLNCIHVIVRFTKQQQKGFLKVAALKAERSAIQANPGGEPVVVSANNRRRSPAIRMSDYAHADVKQQSVLKDGILTR